MSRTYLYGIIDGTWDASLGIPGVDGVSPVRTVSRDGLTCVVSDYHGDDLRTLDREDLIRHLLAHQQVVERSMERRTVLPVKFGTILNTPGEALDLISQERSGLLNALAAVRDKVEVEVAATWDIRQVLQEISMEEPVVRARETANRDGQPTVAERVQLGQMVMSRLDRRKDSYRDRIVNVLKPLSFEVTTNALVSDEMVMNVAFLVDRFKQHDFDEVVKWLDEAFQNEISFKVIGPLPPYSFATVELTRLTTEQIDEAQQTLQMGDVISELEVRKAYRQLAAAGQRSLITGGKSAASQLTKLRQAEEMLIRYCQAGKRNREGGLRAGPAVRDAGSMLFVAIKGSQSNEVESARYSAVGIG